MSTVNHDVTSYIIDTLNELIPDPQPFLHYKDTYTLLIAAILSARCTDKRVNKITPVLFAKADNPRAMVALGQEKIQQIIKSTGLSPQKSKGIWELSKILLAKHKGTVPSDFDALVSLPSVGRKTASVVLVQGFDIPAFPVDTHVFRLSHCFGLSSAKTPNKVGDDLQGIFPKELWGRLHLQFIGYGHNICPARQCNCGHSPICQGLQKLRLSS